MKTLAEVFTIIFIISMVMLGIQHEAMAEYKQPTIEEIRARQNANNVPPSPDPFKKVVVEFVIPEGMAVFTDPNSNCQYFITVDEKGRVTSMVPRSLNATQQMCN